MQPSILGETLLCVTLQSIREMVCTPKDMNNVDRAQRIKSKQRKLGFKHTIQSLRNITNKFKNFHKSKKKALL